MDMAQAFLVSLVPQTPVFVVWLAAVIVAALRWQRHPRVSLFTVLAIVIMAVVTLASTFVSVNLPFYLRERGRTAREIGAFLSVWGTLLSIVRAGCWAMLLVAVFGWREAARPSVAGFPLASR